MHSVRTPSTHESLLIRLSDGEDGDAWQEFTARYGGLIRGYASRWGLQPADCDDVLQEVLLALSRALPEFRYDPERGKWRSYLKAITTRLLSRKTHQRSAALGLEDIAPGDASALVTDSSEVETWWETAWREYHVRRALTRLAREFNERDRIAFTLHALEGRSVKDTANTLGMSIDQVYQAKSRILRRVSQLVHEQVADEG